MSEWRVLSPQGMLGYGYPVSSLQEGLNRDPHVIAVDAGSTDGGPHRLGKGVGGVSRHATKQDLRPLLRAVKERGIPLLIGSAGGSGAGVRVEWTWEIVREIAREEGLSLRVALIFADVDREWIRRQWRQGKMTPLGSAPEPTEKEVEAIRAAVAQMGMEPFQQALAAGAEVVIGGRAYDPVMTAALPVAHGADPALALHMGKILECGALAAVPGSAKDAMLGTLYSDHFVVEPMAPERAATPTSVAAHTFYEKSSPVILPGPGGTLDVSGCRYTAVDQRRVRVEGSRFLPETPYTVKVEAVSSVGFRTVLVFGMRDPILLSQWDWMERYVRKEVADYFKETATACQLHFKLYGRDGVMGPLEPVPASRAHEWGGVLEVVAPDQETADAVAAFARAVMMHAHYPGRRSTSGNLALPFAPPELSGGEVFAFTLYHAVELDDPMALFPIHMREV